jgi:hypothetical protein
MFVNALEINGILTYTPAFIYDKNAVGVPLRSGKRTFKVVIAATGRGVFRLAYVGPWITYNDW